MASPVPKNVAAAIGLVPTVLGGVRRLPAKAVKLPVMAVGTALAGLDAAKREYGDLADRGERLIARLRGVSVDYVEDAIGGAASTAARAAGLNGSSTDNAMQATLADAATAVEREEAAASLDAVQQTLPVDDTPMTRGRVDSAATPDVVEQVDKIAQNVGAPLITDSADLPLSDYDHMTLGSIRGRLRSLDMQQLVQLRDYEKSKADRLPVVTMLDNRIAKLSSGESTPTGSAPTQSPTPAGAKPPKSIGEATGPKNASGPPHDKVRLT